ncbi:MAG: DNA-binding protein [Syntrophobacterales bacterium]
MSRLEDGDIVHDEIERFAREKTIRAAGLIIVGGADQEIKFVVGAEEGRATPVVPMEHVLDEVHEIAGVGTLFPDDEKNPVLHMHMACGRKSSTITGCIREGVRVWHVMEVIFFELADSTGIRTHDPETGFKLLQP